ncbi:hypothetical protein IQ264_15925 [Phormidium sp. LEGE 05292]|nr:hypothetical protein [Phormidium sp. LEGE 05292]
MDESDIEELQNAEIKELITQNLETLNENQLIEVADFIAFLKFRSQRTGLGKNGSKLTALDDEFAEEDELFAE